MPTDLEDAPRAIRVDLAWTGPVETTFRMLVNGQEVFARSFPGERYPAPKRSIVVPLLGVPHRRRTVIQLLSSTFVPAETIEGSRDDRILGVAVEGVWLLKE